MNLKRIGQGLFVLLALTGVLGIATGYTRDLSGDDNKALLTALESIVTDTAHNARGTALVAVTKNTWTALSGVGTYRHLLINCRSVTSGNTATINIWCSDDTGTTWYKAPRADTLAPALAVSIACGTTVPGTPAGTTYYVDSLVISVGPATHIFIEQDAAGTDNFVYEVGGL